MALLYAQCFHLNVSVYSQQRSSTVRFSREVQKLISLVNREKSFIKKDYVQLKFELRIEVEGESRRVTKPEAEKC